MSRSRMKSLFKFGRTKSTTDLAEWSKNDEKLLKAVEGGDAKKVNSILTKKTINPTKIGPRGYSIFHTACILGNEQIVAVLMNHVDDVNDLTLKGLTALQLAASKGHVDIVRRLIQAGADVDMKDRDGKVALHHACAALHLECVQMLLDHNANPKVKDESGKTPLFYAAHLGDLAICKWLVDKGADVNAQDMYNMTPLMAAAREGRKEVCEFLLRKGADPNHLDKEGHNALHYALPGGHHKILKEVFDKAPTRASWDVDTKQPDSASASESGSVAPTTLAALADQVDSVSAFKESPVLEHHPKLSQSKSMDLPSSPSQDAKTSVEVAKSQELSERTSRSGDSAATTASPASHVPKPEAAAEEGMKAKVQVSVSSVEVSRQRSEKAFKELEEEHEQLNEDYSKLSIENLRLRDQVESLQGKLAAKTQQIKTDIPPELEKELQRLRKQLEEEQERTKDLETQLEAHSQPASHPDKTGGESPTPSPDLTTSDNWGDSDEDYDETSRRQEKTAMNDKQMVALLRSQILSLRQENDQLKDRIQTLPNGLREPSPYLFPPSPQAALPDSTEKSAPQPDSTQGAGESSELEELREKVERLEGEKTHLLEQLNNAQISDSASSLQLNGGVQHEKLVRENMLLQEEVERLRSEVSALTEAETALTSTTAATTATATTTTPTPAPRQSPAKPKSPSLVNGADHSEESSEDQAGDMEGASPRGDARLWEEKRQLGEKVLVLEGELEKLRKTFSAILKAGDDLQADYDQLQLQKERLLQEKEDLMKENEFLLSDGNSLHDDLKKLVHELEKMQEKYQKVLEEKEHLERTTEAVSLTGKIGETIKVLEERDKLQAANTELAKVNEKLQHDHEILLEEVESLQEQTSKLTQERDQLSGDMEEVESILEQHEALQQDYAALETDFAALLAQRNSLEQELLEAQASAPAHVKIERTSSASGQDWAAVEAERDAWAGEKEQLEMTIGEQSTANALLEEEMATVRSELAALKERLEAAESGKASLKETLESVTLQMTSAREDRETLAKQLEEAMSRLARAKEATSDLSPIPGSEDSDTAAASKTDALLHQVHSLEVQVSNLQMQLAETDRHHKETVAAYRAHLISAVQGHMDEEVRQALHSIIDLRSMEQFC